MSEFDGSWPGWQLKVEASNALERFAEPLGGLALVETGVDTRSALHSIEQEIDGYVGPTKSEAGITWIHWIHFDTEGNPIYDDGLATLLKDKLSVLDDALQATIEISKPIIDTFKPNVPILRSISDPGILIHAERRSQLRPSHIDFDIVTMWLGATKPGLKVFDTKRQDWLTIDNVPAGHALLWRGDVVYTDDQEYLEPVRHYAQYRSVARRITMISH